MLYEFRRGTNTAQIYWLVIIVFIFTLYLTLTSNLTYYILFKALISMQIQL